SEQAVPRGRILWQGGRGDIFENYLELFAPWHEQGWAITSLDWRGQGGSGRTTPDPHVGHIDDFAHYIADFAAFWATWSSE
ncbi:alpha/beta hydrolase, partial [Acinetobacter baumannii]